MFLSQGLASTCIADIMTPALFSEATAGQPPRRALATLTAFYLDRSDAVAALCTLASLGCELRHCDDQVKATVMLGHRNTVDCIAWHRRAIVCAMVGAVTIARLAAMRAAAGRLLAAPGSDTNVTVTAGFPVIAHCSSTSNAARGDC